MTEDRIATESDVVTKLSRQSAADTLRETTLVIFGRPQAGTPAASHHLTADLAGINALTDALAAS